MGLVREPDGLLRLGGANNFVGGLTVNAGTVQIETDAALGSGPHEVEAAAAGGLAEEIGVVAAGILLVGYLFNAVL